MKRHARKRGNPAVSSQRRRRIRLYHLTSTESYCAIKVGGFRGAVYCAEHPREVGGAYGSDVLLEVLLDMDARYLERYRVPVKWEDPGEAAFDHYYRIPPEMVNAVGTVRKVSPARRHAITT